MRKSTERGETLVEVVMALGILSLVLVSSYALATGTFRLSRGAGQRTQAVNYLQLQAEALRSYRDSEDWDTFTMNTSGFTAANGHSFCMIQKDVSGAKRWQPVDGTDTMCKVGGINLAIKATPQGAVPYWSYRFDFEAKWGTKDDHVLLNTTLTKQDF